MARSRGGPPHPCRPVSRGDRSCTVKIGPTHLRGSRRSTRLRTSAITRFRGPTPRPGAVQGTLVSMATPDQRQRSMALPALFPAATSNPAGSRRGRTAAIVVSMMVLSSTMLLGPSTARSVGIFSATAQRRRPTASVTSPRVTTSPANADASLPCQCCAGHSGRHTVGDSFTNRTRTTL